MMKGRVMLAISSPKGKTNYFSRLFFAKYPGTNQNIFNTFIYDGACKKCKEAGREADCNHEPWKYPSWLSQSSKMEAIKIALGGDTETFNREQKGIITEDDGGAYVGIEYVEKLKKRDPFDWKGRPEPKFCLIAVDPNNGSVKGSDTSFTAMVESLGQFVVSRVFFISSF